jgi:hypothetical protein
MRRTRDLLRLDGPPWTFAGAFLSCVHCQVVYGSPIRSSE